MKSLRKVTTKGTCFSSTTQERSSGKYVDFLPISHYDIVLPYSIDATIDDGKPGRFINHSKTNPNLVPKVVVIEKPRIIFFAVRNI